MIEATLGISFLHKLWVILDAWDKYFFLQINVFWTTPLLDDIFPWYRDATTWYPLYIFLLLFIAMNYGWKGIPWIIGLIITISISDQLSSNLIKNYFLRPRPCSDVFIQQYARLLINSCPVNFSFTSSHATNHFAAAMYIFLTLKPVFKKWNYLFFIWAATICYGHVYVGVHYPIDVIGGALIGCFIGLASAGLFNRRFGLPSLIEPTTI